MGRPRTKQLRFVNLLGCGLMLLTLPIASVCAGQLTALDVQLKKQWPANRAINIVFHGHSVPSGYHVTPDVRPFESYPHLVRLQLKQRYPNAVINVITTSIGGETSVGGAARFAADVLPQQPDLILIDYALNDRNLTLAQTETAWRSMIAVAKSNAIPLMLLTPTGASNADLSNPADPLTQRADLIRSLAASENCLLGDVSAAWVAALNGGTPQSQLLSQGNHPNLAGHQIAANAIYAAFVAATSNTTSTAINSFSAQPAVSASAGAPVTLSWNVTNASTLTLGPGNLNVAPQTTNGTGALTVFPVMTTTYTLTANAVASRQVAVTVPLKIETIQINATNRVEINASGLREGFAYQLFCAPEIQLPFSVIGSPCVGDATGVWTFLDAVTDTQVVPGRYYQIGQIAP